MTIPSGLSPEGVLDHMFLGRQPVLDAEGGLFGYELLFRISTENAAPPALPGVAAVDVVCKAFTELGLSVALGTGKAFLAADAAFLAHSGIQALPAERVVFEIAPALLGDPLLMERCLWLQGQGYAFCVHDPVVLDEPTLLFLRQAMFMKLDLGTLDDGDIGRLLNLPAEFRPLSIACHVETADDHVRAKRLGFEFFQGYYFAAPTLIEGKKLDPSARSLVRILQLIQTEAETGAIEQAFKSEAALTVKLLRLTNSVGIGLRVRVASVRQAINVVGRRHIQRWLQLLLFSGHGASATDLNKNPLMQLAALKGRFMERLAQHAEPKQVELADEAFLVGLMSLLPAALGMTMDAILDQVNVAPVLREALLDKTGTLGQLLALTECFDNEDHAGTQALLKCFMPALTPEVLNRSLADAIAWVQTLTTEAE